MLNTPLSSTQLNMNWCSLSSLRLYSPSFIQTTRSHCMCMSKKYVYNYLIKPESWYKILLLKRWLCIIYNAFFRSFVRSSFVCVPLHRLIGIVVMAFRSPSIVLDHVNVCLCAHTHISVKQFCVAIAVISHVSINELSACVAQPPSPPP